MIEGKGVPEMRTTVFKQDDPAYQEARRKEAELKSAKQPDPPPELPKGQPNESPPTEVAEKLDKMKESIDEDLGIGEKKKSSKKSVLGRADKRNAKKTKK